MALIENTSTDHHKAAMALDLFTKLWCRIENSEDLKFRCKGCPMELQGKTCAAKLWKKENAPYYRDFGSIGEQYGWARVLDYIGVGWQPQETLF